MEDLIDFLCKAKKNTYAGNGKEVSPSCRPNSHDLKYEEENKLYYDSYLGEKQFVGEEAVWVDNKPMWSMNYAGRVTDDNFDGAFLKEALYNVQPDMPCRGPKRYEKGNNVYLCTVIGDANWFHGHEEILHNGHIVYIGYFHGGIIKTIS